MRALQYFLHKFPETSTGQCLKCTASISSPVLHNWQRRLKRICIWCKCLERQTWPVTRRRMAIYLSLGYIGMFVTFSIHFLFWFASSISYQKLYKCIRLKLSSWMTYTKVTKSHGTTLQHLVVVSSRVQWGATTQGDQDTISQKISPG